MKTKSKDKYINQRDSARVERDSARVERDSARIERDEAISERDSIIVERDFFKRMIDSLKRDELTREEFVATLTHDIRNPIGIIKVAMEVLQTYVTETNDEEDYNTMIELIERNIDTTEALIKRLLDAHLIKSGSKLPVTLAKCDIVTITKECINNLIPIVKKRVILDTEGEEEVYGIWDKSALKRAFNNLISNAIKYGDKDREIKISIRQGPDFTSISFKNYGEVIPLKDQTKIFDSYYRSPQHRKEQFGWGLGLTLVKGIAESHNGKVEVTSNKLDGTVFTITLPNDSN